MSNRTMDRPWVFGKKLKIVTCIFFPDSTSTPVFVAPGGGVASVAHTSTGLFTITLADPYHKLVGFFHSMQNVGSSTDMYTQGGAVANVGTATPVTAVVKCMTASTPTDSTADANTSVSVMLVFEDSTALVG